MQRNPYQIRVSLFLSILEACHIDTHFLIKYIKNKSLVCFCHRLPLTKNSRCYSQVEMSYLITSRELSRKFRGFNSGDIFTALDELDQGKKLQAEQRAAKRSPGLDFEM